MGDVARQLQLWMPSSSITLCTQQFLTPDEESEVQDHPLLLTAALVIVSITERRPRVGGAGGPPSNRCRSQCQPVQFASEALGALMILRNKQYRLDSR